MILLEVRDVTGRPLSVARSRGSRSAKPDSGEGDTGLAVGLEAGETKGDVIKLAGT